MVPLPSPLQLLTNYCDNCEQSVRESRPQEVNCQGKTATTVVVGRCCVVSVGQANNIYFALQCNHKVLKCGDLGKTSIVTSKVDRGLKASC